jgi:hypothetical protein
MDNPENTEGAIKNGHSRETGDIGYTRHRTKTNKVKHNTICVMYHVLKNHINQFPVNTQTF